jgi:hypothetical protein
MLSSRRSSTNLPADESQVRRVAGPNRCAVECVDTVSGQS